MRDGGALLFEKLLHDGLAPGYLIARRDLAAKATQINEFVVSAAPSFTQKAARPRLPMANPSCSACRRLKEGRDLCLGALDGIAGVTVPKPMAPSIFFRASTDSPIRSRSAAACWKRRASVWRRGAFGAGGEGSVRICYAANGRFGAGHGTADEILASRRIKGG